jgi:hypothetical protein
MRFFAMKPKDASTTEASQPAVLAVNVHNNESEMTADSGRKCTEILPWQSGGFR